MSGNHRVEVIPSLDNERLAQFSALMQAVGSLKDPGDQSRICRILEKEFFPPTRVLP